MGAVPRELQDIALPTRAATARGRASHAEHVGVAALRPVSGGGAAAVAFAAGALPGGVDPDTDVGPPPGARPAHPGAGRDHAALLLWRHARQPGHVVPAPVPGSSLGRRAVPAGAL